MLQGVFDRGRLLAFHANLRTREGARGGASHKRSLVQPDAETALETLGRELSWHGALSADVILTSDGPVVIDVNPRLVEPGNASRAGVDLVDAMLNAAFGREAPPRSRRDRMSRPISSCSRSSAPRSSTADGAASSTSYSARPGTQVITPTAPRNSPQSPTIGGPRSPASRPPRPPSSSPQHGSGSRAEAYRTTPSALKVGEPSAHGRARGTQPARYPPRATTERLKMFAIDSSVVRLDAPGHRCGVNLARARLSGSDIERTRATTQRERPCRLTTAARHVVVHSRVVS